MKITRIPFVPKDPISLFPSEGEENKKHNKIVKTALRGEHSRHVQRLTDAAARKLVGEIKSKPKIDDMYSFVLEKVSRKCFCLEY
jgi:cytochrome P450